MAKAGHWGRPEKAELVRKGSMKQGLSSRDANRGCREFAVSFNSFEARKSEDLQKVFITASGALADVIGKTAMATIIGCRGLFL